MFVRTCYLTNFCGPPFVGYLKRLLPVLRVKLPTMQYLDQQKLMLNLMSCILITESTDPEIVSLLRYSLEQFIAIYKKKAWKDYRVTAVTDMIRYRYPDLAIEASILKECIVQSNNQTDNFLHAYNQYQQELLSDGPAKYL